MSRHAAVIDVGSNSVRLVIYEIQGRAIWTVFNEKVLAGLGRGMPRTGRLSPEGAVEALNALRRFRAVLDGVRPDDVFTAATAAVREASDREAFVARVLRETGFALRVLAGEEEARLSALGVLAGAPAAEGVVGDLGGSSLELVRLVDGAPGAGVTLPLGPFALQAQKIFDADALGLACEAVIAPHRSAYRADMFHAVGGAWRNIALVHMSLSDYPLKVLHQYDIAAGEAVEVCRFVARQSRASLERIRGLSRRRAETLPAAAVVLRCLLEGLGVRRLAISAYGLREGLLFEAMDAATRRADPLLEGCATLALRDLGSGPFAGALQAWLTPLWSALPPILPGRRDEVMLAAACRLSGLGAHLHPDHRADLAFDLVLRAPIPGQTHQERAFLAQAAFSRYASAAVNPAPGVVERLLTPEQTARARALGAAMRLGCDLSGRSAVLLGDASLGLEREELVLKVSAASADVVLGEPINKRAAQLAGVLGIPFKVKLR